MAVDIPTEVAFDYTPGESTTTATAPTIVIPPQVSLSSGKVEIINTTELTSYAQELDDAFTEFGKVLAEVNELVNTSVNVTPDSSVYGAYGAKLLNLWNNNTSTFSDFKTNFQAWSQAVAVISKNNEITEDLVKTIYANRTTGADLMALDGTSYVSELREEAVDAYNAKAVEQSNAADAESVGWSTYEDAAAYNSGVMTESEFARRCGVNGYTCTDANGNSVTVNSYQEYLDVMYEKYGPGSVYANGINETIEIDSGDSSASSDNYFIQRGDTCIVHGQEVKFFARDGSYNYYVDANGNILIDADGGLRSLDCNENTFNINYLKDLEGGFYGAITTTQSGASSMGLPTEVTGSNTSYDMYSSPDEYVDPATISLENARTYTTNNGFSEDLLSGEDLPEVLVFDHNLDGPGWGFAHPDIKTASNGQVTLVYDERSGMYYQLDDSGTYIRDAYGYTPEDLAKYDVE